MDGNEIITEKFIQTNLLTLTKEIEYSSAQHNITLQWVRLKQETGVDYHSKRIRFGFGPRSGPYSRYFLSTAAALYRVVPAKEGQDGAFKAYICPYSDDRTHGVFLADEATVMFTPDMNGCAFGIGSYTSEGHVLVGHANAKRLAGGTSEAPDFTEQRREQIRALRRSKVSETIIDSSDYGDFEGGARWSAIVIGIYDHFSAAKWKFYYQRQLVNYPCDRMLGEVVTVKAPAGR